MTDHDLDVLRAMEMLGGGFVQAIAKAFYRADSVNYERLKAAFPDIWVKYADLAAVAAKRRIPTEGE